MNKHQGGLAGHSLSTTMSNKHFSHLDPELSAMLSIVHAGSLVDLSNLVDNQALDLVLAEQFAEQASIQAELEMLRPRRPRRELSRIYPSPRNVEAIDDVDVKVAMTKARLLRRSCHNLSSPESPLLDSPLATETPADLVVSVETETRYHDEKEKERTRINMPNPIYVETKSGRKSSLKSPAKIPGVEHVSLSGSFFEEQKKFGRSSLRRNSMDSSSDEESICLKRLPAHLKLYQTSASALLGRRPPERSNSACSSSSSLSVEITPGVFAPLRGSEETMQALQTGHVAPAECMCCGLELICIADAEFVLCPECKVVSPLDLDVAFNDSFEFYNREEEEDEPATKPSGVGLGVRHEAAGIEATPGDDFEPEYIALR